MIIPTAIIGSFFGAYLAHIISTDNLKRAFGALLVMMGAKLLFFK
jgi:uncharacterized membrane protein YfcA